MEQDAITHNGSVYTQEHLYSLIAEAKDYQLTHGSITKLFADNDGDSVECSVTARPIGSSLLPTPFPKAAFVQANNLQYIYNELYMHVASDPDWLHTILEPLMKHDLLIATLWDIYIQVRDQSAGTSTTCALFRSDYMLDQDSALKQVEMNTYFCAGACHSEKVANMHKHLSRIHSQDTSYLQHLPKNQNISAVIELLVTAHHSYIPTKTGKACVLMLVQPMSMNIADERPIESGLWDAEIPCYRCEWEDMLEQTTLSADQTLLFHLNGGDGGIEVGLVYYRAGCEPWEYEHEGKEIRLRCEMSKAVKCPDVLTHLTTMKVVQCALTQPGSLERFLPKQKATMIRQTFMPMQLLDTTPEGLGSRRIASDKERAESYILKPNLEGGRHNIYRSDIPEFLASVPQEEWHKFILMRLIEPPPDVQGFLMTAKDMYHGAVVCELGILGTCVWERRAGSEINPLNNKVAGWTFKTKPAAADEMNVIKGLGCFDCPFLV